MNNLTEIQLNSTSPGCSAMASIMFTSILTVISSTALIGNILVAATVMKTPSLLTSANYYIVNMAFSDLLGRLFNWLLYVSEGTLTPTVFISRTLYGFDRLQIRNVPQSGVTGSLYSKPCVYRLGQICSYCFLKAIMIMNVKIGVFLMMFSYGWYPSCIFYLTRCNGIIAHF